MKFNKFVPKKSLRTQLMIWLILFSVTPLAFIAGYSLVQYQQAIDKVLVDRLASNRREIGVILSEIETGLLDKVRKHALDKSFNFHLSRNNIGSARRIAQEWIADHFAQKLLVFGRTGRLEIALTRKSDGEVKRHKNLEGRHVFLEKKFLGKLEGKEELIQAQFNTQNKKRQLELSVFKKIRSPQGRLVGYIEESVRFDNYLAGLKNRLNIEIFFFSKNPEEKIVSSHADLELMGSKFFKNKFSEKKSKIFEHVIQSTPYGFSIQPLQWGESEFFMGIGASKQAVMAVLRNVKIAFYGVITFVILLVVVLSVLISQSLLRPLNELVDSIQNVDIDGDELIQVKSTADNELGLLSESYNEMFAKVHESQQALKSKIRELEDANVEIRDTQAKLVHSAKMASLGQLVAGVAHELNNPIGFIYSNMGHLRDYSQRLIDLVNLAEKTPKSLPKAKSDKEFDYIVKDMPKLIQSCEDGARRTRDIVLGLRNFSRLEEAKLKEVDLHEGLDNTLDLLRGELKGRVEIKKNYGKIPAVMCYPSQLNQVFMNILSNAAQAIDREGTITLSTKKQAKDKVVVVIEDSGRGMDKETLEKIFDPFFTTKSIGKGTGLGMSITYGIIQKHGGEMTVDSKLGRGTQFTIQLPVEGPKIS